MEYWQDYRSSLSSYTPSSDTVQDKKQAQI